MTPYPPSEEYQVGHVLDLTVVPADPGETPTSTIRARIRHIQHPWTLSCGMVVDLLDDVDCTSSVTAAAAATSATTTSTARHKSLAFLKLYDRRFSFQLRQDEKIAPWTPETEASYISAISSGAAHQFLNDLHDPENPSFEDDTWESWTPAQNEAFLASKSRGIYDGESRAYDSALGPVQGELVPRLLARVRLGITPPQDAPPGLSQSDAMEELHDIKGILLECIEGGFSLSDLRDHAPESEWQRIVGLAIATVQGVGDCGVLNMDVRPSNFIIQKKNRQGQRHEGQEGQDAEGERIGDCDYRAIMIDFGLARLRGPEESDKDWFKAKLEEDEEGAIGYVMQNRLRRVGFELQHDRSISFKKWKRDDYSPS